jgi:hypothetical protein
MRRLKSLTGVLHMPEVKVNFYLSFDEREPEGKEAKKIGSIMDQASDLSPEMQEVLIKFADFLEKHAEKPSGQGPGT